MKQLLIILGIIALIVFGLGWLIRVKNNNAPPATETDASLYQVTDGNSSLEGTAWVVQAIGSEDVQDAQITASFANGTLSGNDGCNRYTTSYVVSGNTLEISTNVAGTLMACPEETMVLAGLFTQTLGDVATFTLQGETLTLHNDQGQPIMTLQQQSQSLSGTSWLITGYNNGREAVVGPMTGTELTLTFTDESTLSGNSGCNTFSGGYSAENGTIAVGAVASTRMLCVTPEGVMEQESQFLTALQSGSTYALEAGMLVTRDTAGAMQIVGSRQ